MSPPRVSIRFVDGGLHEYPAGSGLLPRLHELQTDGLAGKRLIHELFTDDWGVPPLFIDISGTAPDGNSVNVRIPYQ